MPTATVTFNGRVTLPSNLRKELGLKTGDSVDFVEIEKGRFAIQHGAGSISAQKSWNPKMDYSPVSDAQALDEMDDIFQ
jgi:AbrB family looped-hinge helix DNA binding protein